MPETALKKNRVGCVAFWIYSRRVRNGPSIGKMFREFHSEYFDCYSEVTFQTSSLVVHFHI